MTHQIQNQISIASAYLIISCRYNSGIFLLSQLIFQFFKRKGWDNSTQIGECMDKCYKDKNIYLNLLKLCARTEIFYIDLHWYIDSMINNR